MSLKNPFNEKIEGKKWQHCTEPAPLGLNPRAQALSYETDPWKRIAPASSPLYTI